MRIPTADEFQREYGDDARLPWRARVVADDGSDFDLYVPGENDWPTLSELDPAGVLPERVYDRHDLHSYLRHGRWKCRALVDSLTDERARARCAFGSITGSRLELLLYNLRHVQHHAGQLYLLLRQRTDSAPGWVSRARSR